MVDYRLIWKGDDKPVPLRTVFLIFETPTFPSSISIKVLVSLHSKSLAMLRWQRFVHTQKRSTSDQVWGVCGETGHWEAPCSQPSRCVNWSRAHTSNAEPAPASRIWRQLSHFGLRKASCYSGPEEISGQQTQDRQSISWISYLVSAQELMPQHRL